MANTKTAKKQILVSRCNAERNRHYKSTMLSAIKNARAIIEAGENAKEAKKAVDHAVRTLQRTATRNIINRKHASRNIRRLMLAYNKAFSEQGAEVN